MNIDRQLVNCTILQRIAKRRGRLGKALWLLLAAVPFASFGYVASGQVLPNDAMATCKVEPAEFAGWFEGGIVETDGAVNPANGVEFPAHHEDCDFYRWSTRMFLWLTSPTAEGGKVFESPVFFSVSAPESDGSRQLLRNTSGSLNAVVRSAQIIEEGQALTHGVLIAQNESPVYYVSKVNDVFAYFLTRAKSPGMPPSHDMFPTKRDQLEKIKEFAASRGISFPYPDVLVMEVKTAWVETKGLDAGKYITVNAMVPDFDKSDPSKWEPRGLRPAQLALVGMHVAGSVNGQPNLVWATFEHVDNVPVAAYKYRNKNRDLIEVPASTGGPWLFASGSSGPFNVRRQHAEHAPLIEANSPGNTVGPSDTRREHPWGTHPSNPSDITPTTINSVETNTHIIALNNSVIGMLANGDVRRNYLLIGATWNLGEGGNRLANSTIETYVQDLNCSVCHNGVNPGNRNGGVSHVFGPLTPLSP